MAKERHIKILNEEVLLLRKKAEFLEARLNDIEAAMKTVVGSKKD
jgi:hypothetical protein